MPEPYVFEVKEIIDLHYSDVEEIINEQFHNSLHRSKYELPCIEERGSSDHKETWEINLKKEPLDSYDCGQLSEVNRGKWPMYCTRILLQDLCNRSIIPAGTYMIDISW